MRASEILSQASSFGDLLTIAKNATPQISCFGYEYFTVSGYAGTLYIDALAESTIKLITKDLNFAEEDRPILKELSGRIDKMYEESDILVKASNLITRIFYAIRKFISDAIDGGKGVRFHWEEVENRNFKYYTKEQFLKAFGRLPTKGDHQAEAGNTPRWYSQDVKSDASMLSSLSGAAQSVLEQI